MKKLIALTFAASLLLAYGCGSSTSGSDAPKNPGTPATDLQNPDKPKQDVGTSPQPAVNPGIDRSKVGSKAKGN